jgi:hypothetical protein
MRRTAAAERQKRRKGKTGADKGRQQTTRSCRGKRVTAVEMAVQATAVMTVAMAVLAVLGGTRRLAEAGRRGF